MISSIRKTLSFDIITQKLEQIREVKAQTQRFLTQYDHRHIKSQYHLHCLYQILENKWNQRGMDELKQLFYSLNVMGSVMAFVRYVKNRTMGTFTEVSDDTVTKILRLTYMILMINSDETDEQIVSLTFQNVRTLLQLVYSFIYSESRNPKLKQSFLECLSVYRREGETINYTMFSEQLAKNTNNLDQFVDFFCDYMSKTEQKSQTVVQNLLRGLTSRLKIFMECEMNRNDFANILLAFSQFLSKEPSNSEWFSSLLRCTQNSQIFDVMLEFTSKNQNYMKLREIVNTIIEAYMGSQISNFLKFQFISKIYKYIIRKSSSFYVFVKTDPLAEDKEFLRWFIRTELKEEKAREIISVYFFSPYALEFLLIVMIYYSHAFPDEAETVYAFMNNIGFLQESKQFLEIENVRHLLEVFHMQINRLEQFNDYANRIQDRINLCNID